MIDKLITKPSDCTGCYACYSVCPKNCIEMAKDSEGFWYPKIDTAECIDCGLCDNVCPIFNKKEVINTPKAYACLNRNEKIRLESSSGGIFSLLAEYVINENGVVFGACFNKNFEVIHDYASSKNDLVKFRGSKYVQSKIGDTYNQAKIFLQEKKMVLFSGTPCQISGLLSYLGKEYDNLICIDIICHGVPSPDVWSKYKKYRESKVHSNTSNVSFKNKDTGWHSSSEYFKFENDLTYSEVINKDLYLVAFLKNICLRPSCYDCNFKSLHRESDITLADFWGIENVFPELDDNKGTSAIFVNSEKGTVLFDQIKSDIRFLDADIDQIVKYNSSAIKSVIINPKRVLFMKDKDKLNFERLVNKYCKDSLLFRSKRKVKKLLKFILKI